MPTYVPHLVSRIDGALIVSGCLLLPVMRLDFPSTSQAPIKCFPLRPIEGTMHEKITAMGQRTRHQAERPTPLEVHRRKYSILQGAGHLWHTICRAGVVEAEIRAVSTIR